jgi:adenosylcobinamide-GDP ribazoletransferase
VRDALRLALGTLTILPVRAPQVVDRRTAGRAMVLAPLVGLLLGLVTGALLWLIGGGSLPAPLLAAALAVASLALLTRALHLDGLADTADGLGSGRSAGAALEVMRRGDVGPFGTVTLVVALLVQVAALESLFARGDGAVALVVALVVSRLALPLACSRGVPAARADGLGSAVAGSVGPGASAVAVALAALAVAATVVVRLTVWPDPSGGVPPSGGSGVGWSGLLVLLLPLAAAGLLLRRCVRRLGGVTGDVLGACVEVAFTVALVAATVLA